MNIIHIAIIASMGIAVGYLLYAFALYLLDMVEEGIRSLIRRLKND